MPPAPHPSRPMTAPQTPTEGRSIRHGTSCGVEARGMGVRQRIIPGMKAYNGTEPDLVEEENRFTVRLWKEARTRPT